jgi:ABC-type transporter Mla MlaB component
MADPRFHVRIDCRTSTFVLCGDLDRTSTDRLRETLAAIPSPIVTLDLSGLRSIDDAGVACLAAAAQHHLQVVLTGAREEHRALLDIASQRSEFQIREAIRHDRSSSRAADPVGG